MKNTKNKRCVWFNWIFIIRFVFVSPLIPSMQLSIVDFWNGQLNLSFLKDVTTLPQPYWIFCYFDISFGCSYKNIKRKRLSYLFCWFVVVSFEKIGKTCRNSLISKISKDFLKNAKSCISQYSLFGCQRSTGIQWRETIEYLLLFVWSNDIDSRWVWWNCLI